MATSDYKDVAVTSHDTLRFSWSASSQSIANNTTTVSWTMSLITDAYGRIESSAAKNWSVTVNGVTYSGTNYIGIGNNTSKTLASGSTVITHNADGTKSFSYSFSQHFGITFSGTQIGTKTGSGTGTLNTIPRTSSMTVSDGTLGSAQTLTITRQSTSFTHTITAKCGNDTKTVCTKSSSTSMAFTPPLDWASQNTTGTSVSVTYTITTYSGNTSIGTANTYVKTCSIPTSVKPSCKLSVSDAAGYATTYGYLKGLSKFKIDVATTTSYGSAIAEYKVTANGSTYTTSTATTGVLKSHGTLTITATVTDKRGRTGTDSIDVVVKNYEQPKIEYLKVKRVREDGEDDDQGEFVNIQCCTVFTYLDGKNTQQHQLSYSKTSEDVWYGQILDFEVEDSPDGEIFRRHSYFTFPADSGSSYKMTLYASDKFKTVTKNTVASTAFTIMHWLASGLGIAFGKVAEFDDWFDVGFLARFRKGITVDADWVDMTLSSSFKCYEDDIENQPKYRNVGGVVTIKGVIAPISEYTSSNDYVVFASGIPKDLRPLTNQHFVCQGSQMNHWLCTIRTNGNVCISRYGTTEYASVPTSAWLPFTCTYQIN